MMSLVLVSAWLGMVGYVAAILGQRHALPLGSDLCRACWTLGCLLIGLHILGTFHVVHHWDWAHAWEHTAARTADFTRSLGWPAWPWGGGLIVNFVFLGTWAADAGWWWAVGHERYRRRRLWIAVPVHAFLAFIAFNATVVFVVPWYRWIALALWLAGAIWLGRLATAGAGRARSVAS